MSFPPRFDYFEHCLQQAWLKARLFDDTILGDKHIRKLAKEKGTSMKDADG